MMKMTEHSQAEFQCIRTLRELRPIETSALKRNRKVHFGDYYFCRQCTPPTTHTIQYTCICKRRATFPPFLDITFVKCVHYNLNCTQRCIYNTQTKKNNNRHFFEAKKNKREEEQQQHTCTH